MKIVNQFNHNKECEVYECSIYFDNQEQMDRVVDNFQLSGCIIDFPEIGKDEHGEFSVWVGTSTKYGKREFMYKKDFLSAVSKEARRANKQK